MTPNNNKLDKKKLDAYKSLLSKLKETLVYDIQHISSNPTSEDRDSRDISGHVQHMADVATDMYDREFSLELASNERGILQKIELALKKISDRSYGTCSECHKLIAAARLKAIPYAETCLKCQEKIEAGK